MASKTISVLGIQQQLQEARTSEDISKNVGHSLSMIRDHPGHDVYLLPELSATGYSRETFENLAELASEASLSSSLVRSYCSLAEELSACIVFGFPEKKEGRYYITQMVAGPAGQPLVCYRKMHLCQYGTGIEKEYFTPGEAPVIFEVKGMRFSVMICYDMRFSPLAHRLSREHGVDCILHPVAFYQDDSFPSWHSFAITRALENQVYFLSLNHAGAYRGHSIFVPPWMDQKNPPVMAEGTREQVLEILIDPEAIKKSRREYSFRQDEMPIPEPVSQMQF